MKVHFYLFPLFLFITFLSFSQDVIQREYVGIIKSNILIIKPIQQYSISLETITKYRQQTNCFMIGGHLLHFDEDPAKRKALYLAYKRNFYFEPIFSKNSVYISPYSKLIFRDVKSLGDYFTNPKNFKTTSIAVGLDAGINCKLSKRLILGIMGGFGPGYVFSYTNRRQDGYYNPRRIHLDIHFLAEIGLKFGKIK